MQINPHRDDLRFRSPHSPVVRQLARDLNVFRGSDRARFRSREFFATRQNLGKACLELLQELFEIHAQVCGSIRFQILADTVIQFTRTRMLPLPK